MLLKTEREHIRRGHVSEVSDRKKQAVFVKDNNTHTLAWVDDPVLKDPTLKDHPGDI